MTTASAVQLLYGDLPRYLPGYQLQMSQHPPHGPQQPELVAIAVATKLAKTIRLNIIMFLSPKVWALMI